MKQFSLVLFLIFITICSVSNKLYKTKTRLREANPNLIQNLARQGNMAVEDVGCSHTANWVCAKDGKILKSSATQVKYILTGAIAGSCKSIAVDSLGLPWVINDKGDVYRLQKIVGESVVFQKVYEAGKDTPKAIDIACGQFEGTTCFIAVEDSQYPYVYSGKFQKDSELDALSKIKRITVASGKTGLEVIVINEDEYVLHLSRNKAPVSLGMKGHDLSTGYNNDLYVINGYGVYTKSKCSQFFVLLHDASANRVCASTSLWVTGMDNYIYNSTISNTIDGC